MFYLTKTYKIQYRQAQLLLRSKEAFLSRAYVFVGRILYSSSVVEVKGSVDELSELSFREKTRLAPLKAVFDILNEKSVGRLYKKIRQYQKDSIFPSYNEMRKILFVACLDKDEIISFGFSASDYEHIVRACRGFFVKEVRNSLHHSGYTPIARFLSICEPSEIQASFLVDLFVENENICEDVELKTRYRSVAEKEDPVRRLFDRMAQTEMKREGRLLTIGYFLQIFSLRKDILMLKRIYSQYMFSFRNTDSPLFFNGIRMLVLGSMKLDPSFSINLLSRLIVSGKTSAVKHNMKHVYSVMVDFLSDQEHPSRQDYLFAFFETLSLPENIKSASLFLNDCYRATQLLYQTVILHVVKKERGEIRGEQHIILDLVQRLLERSNQEAWPPLDSRTYNITISIAFSGAFAEEGEVSVKERNASYHAALEIFRIARANGQLHSETLKNMIFNLIRWGSWELAQKMFDENPGFRSVGVYKAMFHGGLVYQIEQRELRRIIDEFNQSGLIPDLPLCTMVIQLLKRALLLPKLFQIYGEIQNQAGVLSGLGSLTQENYESGILKIDGHLAAVLFKALTCLPKNDIAIESFSTGVISDTTRSLKLTSRSRYDIVLTSRLTLYRKLGQNSNAAKVIVQMMQEVELDLAAYSAILISLSRLSREENFCLLAALTPSKSITGYEDVGDPEASDSSQPDQENYTQAPSDSREAKSKIVLILKDICYHPAKKNAIITTALDTLKLL